MDLKEYQEFCQSVARKHDTPEAAISCWGLGIAGEAGDVAGCIKKVVYHENQEIKNGIKENLGDTIWYIAMICNHYGWTIEELIEENTAKLKKRYPDERFKLKDAQRKGSKVDWHD